MSNIEIGPYQDAQRRTCIVVGHSKMSVELIPLDTASGLRVIEMQEKSFNKDYKPIPGYPLRKAVEQYIEFAIYCGMTPQVKDIFSDMLTGLAKRDKVDTSLALAKLEAAKVLVPGGKAANPVKGKRADDDTVPWEDESPSDEDTKKTSKKTVGKTQSSKRAETSAKNKTATQPVKEGKKSMATKRTTKVPTPTSQKNTDDIKTGRQSAAQMFRDLILSNSYDDDTIFRMVQKEYGLDDKKRSYVSYYRRELQQKGLL